MMQMEYDEDMYPKYLMGEAMSVAGNYDGAKMQAQEQEQRGYGTHSLQWRDGESRCQESHQKQS